MASPTAASAAATVITKKTITCPSTLSRWREKAINPKKDLHLYDFIEQSIDAFTSLDSKIFQSFFVLIFKPGVLTKDYIIGRRVRYMKPIQIFFIASLIFYLILPNSSAYFSDVFEMKNGYNHLNRLENLFHYNPGQDETSTGASSS